MPVSAQIEAATPCLFSSWRSGAAGALFSGGPDRKIRKPGAVPLKRPPLPAACHPDASRIQHSAWHGLRVWPLRLLGCPPLLQPPVAWSWKAIGYLRISKPSVLSTRVNSIGRGKTLGVSQVAGHCEPWAGAVIDTEVIQVGQRPGAECCAARETKRPRLESTPTAVPQVG